MFIEKIFHVHQPLHVTRSRLANISGYRHRLQHVEELHVSADGAVYCGFELGLGYKVYAELAETEESTVDRVVFQSAKGNIAVAGLVEFFSITAHLTEVVLTVEYDLVSPFHRAFDSLTGAVDRLINSQLRRVEEHFENPEPVLRPAPVRMLRTAPSAA